MSEIEEFHFLAIVAKSSLSRVWIVSVKTNKFNDFNLNDELVEITTID